MAFKFNPLSGDLDITNYPFESTTSQPTLTQDGEIVVARVSNEGRIYFQADGDLFYVTGTQVIQALNILMGQPIGLAGVTYAEDIP